MKEELEKSILLKKKKWKLLVANIVMEARLGWHDPDQTKRYKLK